MKKTIKMFSLMASIALAGAVSPALADTATPAPTPAAPTVTVDGLVDTYFTYNFTNTYSGSGNNTVFYNTVDNSFVLGLAEVDVTATQGPASGHLSLTSGETSYYNFGGTPPYAGGPGLGILQAYVSYVSGQWTFNAGKFVTWMGNEVIQSKSNWNYSRSLLFWDTIPLFHTGLSVAYATSDSKFGVTGYLVNGWNNDIATTADLGEKTYGLQFSIKPDSTLSIVLNGIFGPNPASTSDANDRIIGEGIVTYNATDKLSFALDGEFGTQGVSGGATAPTFWGLALYGRYQVASDYAVALRLEDLNDNGVIGLGNTTTAGQGQEGTLTIEHNLTANTLVRLEGRYDTQLFNGAAVPVFNGGASTSQVTGTASMVFSF